MAMIPTLLPIMMTTMSIQSTTVWVTRRGEQERKKWHDQKGSWLNRWTPPGRWVEQDLC